MKKPIGNPEWRDPSYSDVIGKKITGISADWPILCFHFDNDEVLVVGFEQWGTFTRLMPIHNLHLIGNERLLRMGIMSQDEFDEYRQQIKRENKDDARDMILRMIQEYKAGYNEDPLK